LFAGDANRKQSERTNRRERVRRRTGGREEEGEQERERVRGRTGGREWEGE